MNSSQQNPLVLVVDDDATMRLLVRHTLKKTNFEVLEAETGEQAIDIFHQKKPDVVLLDVMMPGINGYDTCAQMRQLPEGKHVPILMVTGLDDMDSINHAYEAGATDFITKPITYPLLSHRIRYVLRASKAMERVGKSEARLAHAQGIAHLGNWEWDIEQDKIYCSKEIYHIIDKNEQDFDGNYNNFFQILHPEDKAEAKAVLDLAVKTGQSYNIDHRIVLPDGTIRITHQQGEAIFNEQQKVIRIQGTLQDITERKQVENELKQFRNHLQELVEQRTEELVVANTNLKEAKEQAENANNLKDKFISLVAHDLRSPLAGILTALDYVHTDTEDPLNEDHQEIVGKLLKIGKSLVQMIEDVLNIGRLKSGKITPKCEPINAKDTVATSIENLSYLAKQKGILLINEVPKDIHFHADPTLYGEVISNITSNGIKFCKKGDMVRFFIPENQPDTLAIEDTGIGIQAEVVPKLFKIEEKTSTPGTGGEQGTGFGLPFSNDIMLAHQGKITIESTPGEGTTFYISLPNLA